MRLTALTLLWPIILLLLLLLLPSFLIILAILRCTLILLLCLQSLTLLVDQLANRLARLAVQVRPLVRGLLGTAVSRQSRCRGFTLALLIFLALLILSLVGLVGGGLVAFTD